MTEVQPQLVLIGCDHFIHHWQRSLGGWAQCYRADDVNDDDGTAICVGCVVLAELASSEFSHWLQQARACRQQWPVIVVGDGDALDLDWGGRSPHSWLSSQSSSDQLLFAVRKAWQVAVIQAGTKDLLNTAKNDSQRFRQVQEMALLLNSSRNFDELFQGIIHHVTQIMAVDRTSLFLLDSAAGQLWTKVAEGVDEQIRMPVGVGLAGCCASSEQSLRVNDAANHIDFDSSWDRQLGYTTYTVLCLPVYNRAHELKGVLQMINKCDGLFDDQDDELAAVCAAQVGVALENFQLLEELRQGFESFIRALTETLDAKHRLTAGHSHRVTEYALFLGRALALDEVALDVLKYAALLHDLGKIAVPDRVLTKNGRFSAEELSMMQSHPLWTGRILNRMLLPRHLRQLPQVASSHHERMDGSGYPQGSVAGQIPYLARIIAVADVFDALSSKRDYPKYGQQGESGLGYGPLDLDRVFCMIEQDADSHLDPMVVEAALRQRPALEQLCRQLHAEQQEAHV